MPLPSLGNSKINAVCVPSFAGVVLPDMSNLSVPGLYLILEITQLSLDVRVM